MKRRTPGNGIIAFGKEIPSGSHVLQIYACRFGEVPRQSFEHGAHIAGFIKRKRLDMNERHTDCSDGYPLRRANAV